MGSFVLWRSGFMGGRRRHDVMSAYEPVDDSLQTVSLC